MMLIKNPSLFPKWEFLKPGKAYTMKDSNMVDICYFLSNWFKHLVWNKSYQEFLK